MGEEKPFAGKTDESRGHFKLVFISFVSRLSM
jgi:hypothetical protein